MNLTFQGVNFATSGLLNETLTVAGESIAYGKEELLLQDSAILGWTCGNAIASGQAIARFYYELLRPGGTLLSPESLAVMTNWSVVNKGWANGTLAYGAGLMINNVSPKVKAPASQGDFANYVGHGGDTYAFTSDNGFFAAINASISVIVNQDYDWQYPTYVVTCPVLELAARYKLGHAVDLGCVASKPRAREHYVCQNLFGQPTCVGQTLTKSNLTRDMCQETCGHNDHASTRPVYRQAPLGGGAAGI